MNKGSLVWPALLASACAAGAQVRVAEARTPAAPPASAWVAVDTSYAGLPQAPSAIVRPLQLPGGVIIPMEQPGVVSLTLDEAVSTALKGNAQIVLDVQQERFVNAQILTVANALLPDLEFKAYSQAQEINLTAEGLNLNSLKGIMLPGFNVNQIKPIVKVNTTDAQVSLSQAVFNVPAFFLYRAAQKASEAANWQTLSARGGVVLQTGMLYLQALADQAQVRNAEALVRQDQVVFENARAQLQAGTGIRLDALRAQVQLQNEQQTLISAENAVAKDKVNLNRAMGQPAGQTLELVDTVPFQQFETMSVGEALEIGYIKRKDLRGLEAQLEVALKTAQAVKYQRLPTLGIGGFYGVLGETTGIYHGVFAAEGQLNVPIFEEALLRGQKEVAVAQTRALQQAIISKRVDVEGDIRGSLLDVQSAAELVRVSRSSAALSQQALDDATARFTAGVDDDLPVVRAQATLAGAENQVVQAEFQYNVAKLQLARNTGVVETEYKRYLGK